MIRLTDAAAIGVPACTVQYSTKSPFNSDNSKILVLEVANFAVYDVATSKKLLDLVHIGDSNEPLWSKSNPDRIYWHFNNRVGYTDITAPNSTQLLREFPEYSDITGKGEGDIQDGKIALLGDGRYVFLLDLETGVKGPVLDTQGVAFDSVYATPDGNCLISWGITGEGHNFGVELFDQNMQFVRQLTTYVGHKDVTRDVDGSEVMVITDNNTNAVMKVRLSDGKKTEILLPLPWNLAVHISCPDSAGFAIVSSYGVGRIGEILQVPLTSGSVRSLGVHGSDSSTYDGQPRAAVSSDGKLVAYNSNANGLTDVYLLQTDAPEPKLFTHKRVGERRKAA